MAHASVKLNPGVDQNETPALNETGISTSHLIRFIPDRVQGALTQKLGGWTKYPNSGQAAMPAVVRALWAWEDTNANSHLAVGTGNSTANVSYLALWRRAMRGAPTESALRRGADTALPAALSSGHQYRGFRPALASPGSQGRELLHVAAPFPSAVPAWIAAAFSSAADGGAW